MFMGYVLITCYLNGLEPVTLRNMNFTCYQNKLKQGEYNLNTVVFQSI